MGRLNEKTARNLLERVSSIWDGTSTEDPHQSGLHDEIKSCLGGDTIAEAETAADAKKSTKGGKAAEKADDEKAGAGTQAEQTGSHDEK